MNSAIGTGSGLEQRLPSKAIMPLLSLQRHWKKSALVFLLVAGVGLPLAWIKGTATYYAEAVVHVNFRFAPNLATQEEVENYSIEQYERLVQQQLRTITRYDVVRSALDSLGDERRLWQRPDESEEKAVRRLMGALQVNAVRDTYLITVGLENQDPDLIPRLVNPVVENYLATERKETFFGSDLRLQNLEQREDELLASIEALSAELQAKAGALGITTFEERFMNPYDKILVDMDDSLAQAWQARLTAAAELDALIAKHAQLLEIPLDSEAEKMAANDRALGDLRTFLYKRRAELVQTMSGLTPSHDGRKAAEREIEQINREIVAASEKTRTEIKAILEERRQADIQVEEAEYRARLAQAQQVERGLGGELERRKQDVVNFVKVYNEARGIKEEIERQRRQLEQIKDRIDSIEIEETAPGYARLVSLASVPELPQSGGRKKLFILFLVAASGMALVLPMALDFVDSRIRTPIDLHRVLGFAPSSWLPEIVSDETQVLFKEQMERLAITILRDVRGQDTGRSFFVTEPLPGSGKTFLTNELADRLEKHGLRTVAIAADPANQRVVPDSAIGPSTPDQEPRTADAAAAVAARLGAEGPPPSAIPGLVEVLAREASLDQVLVSRGAGLADRMPFGARQQSEWIQNTMRMQEIFGQLVQRYDVVLIDGPATLMSAAAEAIAGICYGALIVVGAIDTPVRQLKRAAAIIERAEPEVVGAVLNRTPLFQSSGYFNRLAKSLALYHAPSPPMGPSPIQAPRMNAGPDRHDHVADAGSGAEMSPAADPHADASRRFWQRVQGTSGTN